MALNNQKPARDMGYQNTLYIAKDVTYADNGKVITIGTIPSGAVIKKASSGVLVHTAFNAGTGNVIDIGTTADDDLYGTDLALGTAAFVSLDEVVSYKLTADTTFTATIALTGTAASAGAATVFIEFFPRVS